MVLGEDFNSTFRSGVNTTFRKSADVGLLGLRSPTALGNKITGRKTVGTKDSPKKTKTKMIDTTLGSPKKVRKSKSTGRSKAEKTVKESPGEKELSKSPSKTKYPIKSPTKSKSP